MHRYLPTYPAHGSFPRAFGEGPPMNHLSSKAGTSDELFGVVQFKHMNVNLRSQLETYNSVSMLKYARHNQESQFC